MMFPGLYLCCGIIIIIIIIVVVLLLVFLLSNGSKSKRKNNYYRESSYPDQNEGFYEEDQAGSKGFDEDEGHTYTDTGFDKKNKRHENVSFLDRILNKKRACDDCGSELVYKKSYDSYYCPECRTFK